MRARCRPALSRLSTPPVAIALRPAAASSNSRSARPRVHKVSRCCAATSKAAVRSGVSPAARASRAAAASSRRGVIWVVRGAWGYYLGWAFGNDNSFFTRAPARYFATVRSGPDRVQTAVSTRQARPGRSRIMVRPITDNMPCTGVAARAIAEAVCRGCARRSCAG